MYRFLLLSVAVLAVSGCARLIEGSTQKITIETPGADGAACFIENEEFRYKIYAPQTITITRSFYPLNVRCLAPGNRQKTVTVRPKIQEATYMNAVNGFVPGMVVDYNSRAFYKFPEKIVVDFTDMAPGMMPVPHYDRLLKENPHLRGWEEFRPGLPALQRDQYDTPVELQRRVVPGADNNSELRSDPVASYPVAPPSGNNADGAAPMPLMRDDNWIK
ncbi:MAG: hypothetical protein KKA05_05115 [Alphaproteobacteria bacterium]|nr:hypothetical protein [Alphaproteobacteria bacterium]